MKTLASLLLLLLTVVLLQRPAHAQFRDRVAVQSRGEWNCRGQAWDHSTDRMVDLSKN